MIGYLIQRAGCRFAGRKFTSDQRLARVTFLDEAAADAVAETVFRVPGLAFEIERKASAPDPDLDPTTAAIRNLTAIDGIGPAAASRLIDAGLGTREALKEALSTPEGRDRIVAAIPGIDPKDLPRWKRQL